MSFPAQLSTPPGAEVEESGRDRNLVREAGHNRCSRRAPADPAARLAVVVSHAPATQGSVRGQPAAARGQPLHTRVEGQPQVCRRLAAGVAPTALPRPSTKRWSRYRRATARRRRRWRGRSSRSSASTRRCAAAAARGRRPRRAARTGTRRRSATRSSALASAPSRAETNTPSRRVFVVAVPPDLCHALPWDCVLLANDLCPAR